MPGVSDPGAALVEAAIVAGVPVVPVPGPSAVLAALVVSGLPTREFTFVGFLPAKSSARQKRLQSFARACAPLAACVFSLDLCKCGPEHLKLQFCVLHFAWN
jgi:16S rRNA (cytidine1402-2'-O)-methyltransferase